MPRAFNFIKKETLAQVSSCKFCEISKNIFSYRTPPVAASVFFNVSLLLPKRFTLRYLPPPLLYSEVLFLFLILYLGALFYKKKKNKRKEKKKIFIENHKKIWEIVVLTDRCIIKKMISKKNVM